MSKNITLDEAKNKILADASAEDIKSLLTSLSKLSQENNKVIINHNLQEFEAKLEQHHINDICPYCGEKQNIIRNGKYRNGTTRYHCKACGKNYNRFTNTFIAQTRFGVNYWIQLIWLELNVISIQNAKINLENNEVIPFVDTKTIWSQRMKLMAATHNLQPNLSGIVEIDECHIREAQKGERELINYEKSLPKREARYSYKASKLGTKGGEFICIVCAVDRNNQHYAFISGIGPLKKSVFLKEVVPHIKDASFLCSDANVIYTGYSQDIGLPHYVKPSNYDTKIRECHSDAELSHYYHKQWLDYLLNSRRMNYKQFCDFRDKNKLGIGHINGFHTSIKKYIEDTKAGVNLEYAEYYLDWITYCKNIANVLGHTPTSMKDAKFILFDLLSKSTFISTSQIQARNAKCMPKPSKQYSMNLWKATQKVRNEAQDNKYILTSEEIGDSFSIRQQIDAITSISVLKEMGKDLKIKGYSKAKKDKTWALRKSLEKHPDIELELAKIRAKYPKEFNNIEHVK